MVLLQNTNCFVLCVFPQLHKIVPSSTMMNNINKAIKWF